MVVKAEISGVASDPFSALLSVANSLLPVGNFNGNSSTLPSSRLNDLASLLVTPNHLVGMHKDAPKPRVSVYQGSKRDGAASNSSKTKEREKKSSFKTQATQPQKIHKNKVDAGSTSVSIKTSVLNTQMRFYIPKVYLLWRSAGVDHKEFKTKKV
jgi:hypothetical protein